MMDEKTLEFKVKDKTGKWVDPRWRAVESKNTKCPRHGTTMVVVSAGKQGLYAYCRECDCYYIGE
jgi:hypothetical protein